MPSGSDPWEGQTYRARPEPGGGGSGLSSLLKGPNLPFLLLIVIGLAIMVTYLVMASPFADDGTASGSTTTRATTSTTAGGGDSTTTTTGGTGTTTADGSSTTTVPGATTTPTLPPDAGPLQGLALQQLASGIPFPVYATAIPGTDRILVLERQGRVMEITSTGGTTTYLDLLDRVGSGGIENGLLGLAFHPDFATNGKLYVYYTGTDLNSRIVEFTATSADATSVSAGTEKLILQVQQQGIRHRAGMLNFGPDGYLWIALGDGGLGDDSAQNLEMLQGSILRIDVDGGDPYAIPPDNPYVGTDGLDEIWAHGLRNPWRFALDPTENLIYIGDVGQATWEEINVQPMDEPGIDYGWPNFEGTDCYQPSDGCTMTGWVEPTVKYSHEDGCSVTGGFVYRGSLIPELYGHYFYADWCNGWIRSFRYENGVVTEEQDWSDQLSPGQVSSFGLDKDGELLVVDSNGTIYRIIAQR